jgi:hypothetical protein
VLVLDFDINCRLERAQGITKHDVVIQVYLVKPTYYTTVCAKTVVTQATSYDVLVGGGNFVPLGIHPRFLGGNYLYKLGWQIRNRCKAFLPVTFIRGHVRKSSNSMMLARFLGLPHGFDLLEGNAHAMDSLPTHEL